MAPLRLAGEAHHTAPQRHTGNHVRSRWGQVGHTLGWGAKPQAISAATERLRAALEVLCELRGIGG